MDSRCGEESGLLLHNESVREHVLDLPGTFASSMTWQATGKPGLRLPRNESLSLPFWANKLDHTGEVGVREICYLENVVPPLYQQLLLDATN